MGINKLEYTEIQKATILAVIITSFVTTFMGSALNLSITAISKEFDASAVLTGWIVMGYSITAASFSIPFGSLADRMDKKKLLLLGTLLFCILSFASAFAWNMTSLLTIRVLNGIVSAMIFATNMPVLIGAFPQKLRGRVIGFSVASTYIGLSAGPVVGGAFNHYLGWRSIFILGGIAAAAACVTIAKKLPAYPPHARQEGKEDSDIAGNLLCLLMIPLMMYGLSTLMNGFYGIGLFCAGIILLILFNIHERSAKAPVVDVTLFKNSPAYLFSNLAALFHYAATFGLGYLLSIYLQSVMGYTSQTAGLILISQPLFMALLSPKAGRLSDHRSPFVLAAVGMGLSAFGIFLISFIGVSFPMPILVLELMIVGVGFALFSSPNTNAILSGVASRQHGEASSMVATMRTVGQTSSMAVITLIVAFQLGNSTLAAADPVLLVHTIRMTLRIFAGLCVCGVFFSLTGRKKQEIRNRKKEQ